MRQKYWYLGSICSVALTVASIIACGGDPSLQEECLMDTDCSIGTICDGELGFCVALCNDDSECAAGEICEPRASAPGSTEKVCQSDPGNNNNNMQCTDNEECNTDEICQNGSCVQIGPTTIYRYIVIEDVSSGNSSCNSTTANGLKDAGSDIFSVELLDSQGQAIGYGQAINYEPGTGDIDTSDFGILDGQPRNVDARECPAAEGGSSFRIDSVVSLGCGGHLLLNFSGSNGQPVNLENGFEIFVGEYAPVCNQSGGSSDGSDRYQVSICTDTDSASNQSITSCTRQIGNAQGGNGNFRISGL